MLPLGNVLVSNLFVESAGVTEGHSCFVVDSALQTGGRRHIKAPKAPQQKTENNQQQWLIRRFAKCCWWGVVMRWTGEVTALWVVVMSVSSNQLFNLSLFLCTCQKSDFFLQEDVRWRTRSECAFVLFYNPKTQVALVHSAQLLAVSDIVHTGVEGR